MKKYTRENSIITHEIGHFIMFLLYLSTKRGFNKDMFLSSITELSICHDNEDNSDGHVTVNDDRLYENSLCCSFTLLGGVLFDILLVEHSYNFKYKFFKLNDIINNHIDVYDDFGGSGDLLRLCKKKKRITFISSYIASNIIELKGIIYELLNNETIRKIIRSLHRNLQKDKCISGNRCYSIVESYIPELKQLGKNIYCPKMKLKIRLGYAKAVLLQ